MSAHARRRTPSPRHGPVGGLVLIAANILGLALTAATTATAHAAPAAHVPSTPLHLPYEEDE
ncbi:hypothetical protein ACFRSX_31000 [Streptomyces goshikiensis]|uniref:hypothetical protein n=1 Tax=Streptomyces TaxID=1883 RepID=UPI000C27F630|nr:hypothetical protein [Streptomyces sp. CB02120-2]PJN14636.1 hypothetical protein CG724_33710 [Streptomyces sp. CB02120-2]